MRDLRKRRKVFLFCSWQSGSVRIGSASFSNDNPKPTTTMTTEINTAKTDTASLTQNEKTFLKLCLNYDTVEAQIGDNYSNGGIDEAMNLFDGTKQYKRQAAGGLLSSLQQKGMGWLDTECDMFCLTKRGIYAAFSA